MKTLDQTIEALSAFYSGLEIPEGEEPLLQCAFHYLQEYRDHLGYTEKVRKEFEEARDKHLAALKDIYEERKKLIAEIRDYQGKTNEVCEWNLRYSEKYIEYRKMIDEMERNDPMSWDELKQIKATTPIWITIIENGFRFDQGWILINEVDDAWMYYTPLRMEYSRQGHGETWEAYRKERKHAKI